MREEQQEFYPVALTIAGSDSGGGAGIQADLRTFSAFGVFGSSVVTAITAQNPFAVTHVAGVAPLSVRSQLEAVFDRLAIQVVKTGMLFNLGTISEVVAFFDGRNLPVIVDPVMVSTSGHRLLEDDALTVLTERLLPLATWVTPNRMEAEILVGRKIGSEEQFIDAALECSRKWGCGCVLKGGHFQTDSKFAQDAVAYEQKVYCLSSPVVESMTSVASHGTGCTFSSAFAALLALGESWQDALLGAKAFVFGSLQDAVFIGEGTEAMYPPLKNYLNKVKFRRIH